MKKTKLLQAVIIWAIVLIIGHQSILASSHREAPLISNDPLADNVDLYAFRSPDDPNTITIIATYVPMQLPHGGPNYYSFGENIRYEIHVDNDATIPGDEVTYRFTFNKVNQDPTTFFNIRLGNENLKTTYNLERSFDNGMTWELILENGVVPPNNIGARSINSPVGLNSDYTTIHNNAISTSMTGEKVFCGPTDDPFFVDLGGIFDLGDAPRQLGEAVDGLACLNVSAIAIQVPISTLLKASAPSTPTSILDPDYVIGVWASASRPAITTISKAKEPSFDGDWIQVSRLGMPLTNEAVIPIGQKDFWNRLTPYDEISETSLDEYFYNPELALYMDDEKFGGAVPGFFPLRIQKASLGSFNFSNGGDGLYSLKGDPVLEGTALDDDVFGTLLLPAVGKPRSVDLWPAFHTGVPNAIPYQLATGKNGNPLASGKPFINNFLPNGGDMLRLNMAVPITPRDDDSFSSLGLIQAAVLGLTAPPYNTSTDLEFIPNMDGFPNGRRLEDDVTRIELQAVSGVVLAAVGLWYDDFESGSPLTPQLLSVLGYTTGVEQNDKEFRSTFPYLALPFSGTGDCSGRPSKSDINDDNVMGRLFTSSNTSGRIGYYGIDDNKDLVGFKFASLATDADGIHYDEENDVLIQLNRVENRLDAYSNVMTSLRNGAVPTLMFSSSSDFSNGREISVSGNRVVVTQDANDSNGNTNKLYVYQINDDAFELKQTFDLTINLWGIHADLNTLYAIVDNSNRLALFEDFFLNQSGMLSPTATVSIEGITRTHGLTYSHVNDVMILTDIGEASSNTDGGLVVIKNFLGAISDDEVSNDEQIRLYGEKTSMGNPVDVAYDIENEYIFIAERANQQLLVFNTPNQNGDVAPFDIEEVDGISAVYLVGSTRDGIIQTSTSEIESETSNMTAYPNPTQGIVNLSWGGLNTNSEETVIEIFDITGKTLRKFSDKTYGNYQVDLSSYESGAYFIKCSDSKNEYTVKVIKY